MLIRRPDQSSEIKSLSGLLRGGALCAAVLVSLLIMGLLSAQARAENPNAALPTLGGTQLWADEHLRGGWRIQRHVWTGHYRLLDSNNVRHAWGSYADCLIRLSETGVRHPKTGIWCCLSMALDAGRGVSAACRAYCARQALRRMPSATPAPGDPSKVMRRNWKGYCCGCRM